MPFFRVLTPAVLCVLPAAAEAGLEFCNNSDETISVAIGYDQDGTWTSEGWWAADPGDCTTPVPGELSNRYYYWRATSASRSWERDDQRFMFCTSAEAFTIEGDDRCGDRGYRREAFNEIDLDGSSGITMTLGPDTAISRTDQPGAHENGGDAPGTWGEPFTISGLLSHCDWYDAGLGCTVLAEGFSYIATSYDHTPEDVLVAMDGLGVNVPISISGDMISYEGAEALVTIRDWTMSGADPFAEARAGLQGFWTSTEDARYQLSIYGARFEEYYDQVPQDAFAMHFRSGCPDVPGDDAAFQLVARDGAEDRCAVVSGLSQFALELFVAGTMRPLTFRREQ